MIGQKLRERLSPEELAELDKRRDELVATWPRLTPEALAEIRALLAPRDSGR